jgi:sugar lactone lactonase YvrE
MIIERKFQDSTELGEGPVWEPISQTIYWVDILQGLIFYSITGALPLTLATHQPVGCVVPHEDGSLIAALKDGIYRIDRKTKDIKLIAAPPNEIHGTPHRFNDGKCDKLGRLWVGSTTTNETISASSLYCLDLNGELKLALDNITVSNGLGWSPDNKTFYFIDSPTRRIDAFDYELSSGTISNRRTVIDTSSQAGLPDGLSVDSEGMLWVAHWDGYRICRWNPYDGRCLETVELPVARITSCCFVGDELNLLFVTTARIGQSSKLLQSQPLAGSTFIITPDCKGLALTPCHAKSTPPP